MPEADKPTWAVALTKEAVFEEAARCLITGLDPSIDEKTREEYLEMAGKFADLADLF